MIDPAVYCRVVRYGRSYAPAEGVQAFLDRLANESHIPSHNEDIGPDGYDDWSRRQREHERTGLRTAEILADYLGDHDDPLEDVVRRHHARESDRLERGVSGGDPYPDSSHLATVSSSAIPLEHGTLGLKAKAATRQGRKPQTVAVRWTAYSSHPEWQPTSRGIATQPGWASHFSAQYEPSQLRELAGKFPDEHRDRIHKFLDENFPPKVRKPRPPS